MCQLTTWSVDQKFLKVKKSLDQVSVPVAEQFESWFKYLKGVKKC